MEVCNLGVIVICPELNFSEIKMVKSCRKRIKSIFGKNQPLDQIESTKQHFSKLVKDKNIITLNALKQFQTTRANAIQLTEPKSMLITNPQKDIDELFDYIFRQT
jgi:hypothetical protein